MKLFKLLLGICLIWLCCLQGALAQVSTGTGFAVVSGVLVTNHHVIEGCSSVEVKTKNGRHKSVVLDADPQSDLALLDVPTLIGLSAKIRNPAVVNLGEPVLVFGFPLAGALTSSGNFTSGLVSGLRGLGESEGVFQITAPVQMGNSGGPVLDASGQVIGVVTSKLNAVKIAVATGDIPQNINFATTPEALNDFLMKNQVPVEYFSSKKSLSTASIAKLAQSFTYQIECMGKSQQAKETTKTAPKVAVTIEKPSFKDCDGCPEMVVIPAGNFLMGSPAAVVAYSEQPQHRVNVQKFAIGKYEVTQDQWIEVMRHNPSFYLGKNRPVESISWEDANNFVTRLSKLTGKNYRLPSESEWEYVASDSNVRKTIDANYLLQHAWTDLRETKEVGLKTPNKFGIYDILGNVNEWTKDCWNEDYSMAPTDGSAWSSGNCNLRVFRGMSYMDKEKSKFAITYRHPMWPSFKSMFVGFRIARDLP